MDEDVGIGLAFERQAGGLDAVEAHIEQRLEPRSLEDGPGVLARGDERNLEPVGAQLADEADGAFENVDPVACQQRIEQLVLPVPKPADRLQIRRVLEAAEVERNVSRLEKAAHAFMARLPVDVAEIVLVPIERLERGARSRGAVPEVAIEQRLPGRCMEPGGLGDDTVEVEDRAIESFEGYGRCTCFHSAPFVTFAIRSAPAPSAVRALET